MNIVTMYAYGSILVRAALKPDNTSLQTVTLMGADTLVLNVTVSDPIKFQIGDYCYFFNKLYQVNARPKRTIIADRKIVYNITLESEMYDLGKVEFLFLDANNNFTQGIFSFRGTAQDFGDLLIANMLRVYPTSNWTLGTVVESGFITTDFQLNYVTQTFNCQNCLQALKTIAGIFSTEYLVENKVINIYQRMNASGITLKRGLNEALLSIDDSNQTNANLITRLYAYGSTKNIVANTY